MKFSKIYYNIKHWQPSYHDNHLSSVTFFSFLSDAATPISCKREKLLHNPLITPNPVQGDSWLAR